MKVTLSLSSCLPSQSPHCLIKSHRIQFSRSSCSNKMEKPQSMVINLLLANLCHTRLLSKTNVKVSVLNLVCFRNTFFSFLQLLILHSLKHWSLLRSIMMFLSRLMFGKWGRSPSNWSSNRLLMLWMESILWWSLMRSWRPQKITLMKQIRSLKLRKSSRLAFWKANQARGEERIIVLLINLSYY